MRNALVTWVLFGVLLGTVLLGPPVLALSAARPETGRPVLVVTWPGDDAARLIAGAGGMPVPGSSGPVGTLAIFADPGFPDRLAGAGALFLIDADAARLICGEP